MANSIDVLSSITSEEKYQVGPYAPGGPGALLDGLLYKKSVEVLDLPDFAGAQSMFNPYVIFSLYEVGQGGQNALYTYKRHYDMVPSGFDETGSIKLMPTINLDKDIDITKKQDIKSDQDKLK